MATRTTGRWWPLLVVLGAATTAAWGWSGSAGEKGQKQKAPQGGSPIIYGTSACSGCHNRSEPYHNKENPAICLLTEMPIWEKQDKHAIAHQVLTGARAKRMGEILGSRDITRDERCVSCHSFQIPAGEEENVDPGFKAEQGVSCVACHGPDGGWVDMHGAATLLKLRRWRQLDRATKETQYGMTDLWDPVKRTRLCASCHVGDHAAGKVVTHEMYAAGHPPLPGFEVATFSNQMPRHWEYLKEKLADGERKKVITEVLKFDPAEATQEETHLAAVGGLVSLQMSMDLLAAQAGKDWPELAQFDCYACHHELKSKSWRQQERGYAGKPGRPPMRPWPTALADLGLFHAAGHDKVAAAKAAAAYQARLGKLQAAFDREPFGASGPVREAAQELSEWAGEQVEQIRKNVAAGRYDAAAPSALQARLVDRRARAVPDYDSARQLAWAYTVLHREAAPAGRAQALEASDAWQALDAYLNLRLPVGQAPLEKSLGAGLDRIGSYEPRLFFQRFDAVLQQFPADRPK